MAKPWMVQHKAGGVLVDATTALEPLGVVTSRSVVQLGYPEVQGLTGEVYGSQVATESWEVILHRICEAAAKLGADGVHSIKLSRRLLDPEMNITQFLGTGTAVRGLPQDRVWTTEAGPNELAILIEAGYAPRRLSFGSCIWRQSMDGWRPTRRKFLGITYQTNQEIAPATLAARIACSTAMEQLQKAVRKSGGVGVVGARVGLTRLHSPGRAIGFIAWSEAFGTSVIQYSNPRNLDPHFYVSMKG